MRDMHERRRLGDEIVGLLLVLVGILLLASLVSFRESDTPLFGVQGTEGVANWIGLMGAWLSAGLFWLFGRAAFVFVLWAWLAGWNLLRGTAAGRSVLGMVMAGLLLPVVAVGLAFFNPPDAPKVSHWYGGVAGFYLLRWLEPLTGRAGLALILVFALLVCVVVIFGVSFTSLFKSKGRSGRGPEGPEGGGPSGGGFVSRTPGPAEEGEERGEQEDGRQVRKEEREPPFFGLVGMVAAEGADGERPPLIERVRYVWRDVPAEASGGEGFGEEVGLGEAAGRLRRGRAEGGGGRSGEESSPRPRRRRGGSVPFSLLKVSERPDPQRFSRDIRQTSQMLEEVLRDFGIEAKVVHTEVGPSITRYEMKVPSGVRLSRITALADNIAMALGGQKVRVVAPIPGKAAVGVEVPNRERVMVTLGDLLSRPRGKRKGVLEVPLGLDVSGQPVFMDLAEAPHLLVAGSTGSGKSVCLNALICSLLCTCSPEEVRFILVDPKMVELKIYNGIEHLLTEVITNPRQASLALRWAVNEMERRYAELDAAGARDILRYNERTPAGRPRMPYIVVVVDELADLMMVAQKDVEESIARLAQKARAVGIHLVLATQRPSVDVITGVVKANFPSRIAFQVASRIDSRTILDQNGAEQLLRKGDMLVSFAGSSDLLRVQGVYISDEELAAVTDHLKDGAQPDYDPAIVAEPENGGDGEGAVVDDGLYRQAVEIVRATRKASASYLQRRLQIGYNRAARYIDMMEQEGLIGPQNGSRPREVYL